MNWFRRAKPKDFIHGKVRVYSPSLEEMKEGILPDKFLETVAYQFDTDKGILYCVDYHPTGLGYPRLLNASRTQPEVIIVQIQTIHYPEYVEDAHKIRDVVRSAFGAEFNEPLEMMNCWSVLGYLARPKDHGELAGLTDKLQQNPQIRGFRVVSMSYSNVPDSAVNNSSVLKARKIEVDPPQTGDLVARLAA